MTVFAPRDLHNYASALLRAGGYTPDHAENTAKVLVWANARGANSHGVLRIPRYVEMVEEGTIDPKTALKVESRQGAVAVIEAARSPGASAMIAGMEEAISIAAEMGIGWCSVRNITHAGAVGYYACEAARRGYIGVVITASGPLMAYHGAAVSGVSTNPISIAAPSAGAPVLLDMSTSTVALGKIMHARDTGKLIPEGWGMNAAGAPETDPDKVKTLTPLGGPKGSGLSLMIEILASVLISNPVISVALSGGKGAMNGVALALKVASFSDVDGFAEQVAETARLLKGLPKAQDTDEILMPGERGFRQAEVAMKNGIEIANGTVKRLAETAHRLKLEPLPA